MSNIAKEFHAKNGIRVGAGLGTAVIDTNGNLTTPNITGLVMGNGSSVTTAAQADVDYATPALTEDNALIYAILFN